MTLSLDQALELPFGTLSKQEASTLAALKQEAAARLQAARNANDAIDAVLLFRYGQQARDARLAIGKDAGVVHLDDAGVRVTVNQPKRVEWDQAKLAAIAARITAQGEDPTEFISVSYTVSESKYNAWSTAMREPFQSARLLKTGKPSFHFDPVEVTP